MSQNNKLITNGVLNIIRRTIGILVPLFVYPYVARVLGAENTGKIAYSRSIIQYFLLFSSLGISSYGIREVAKVRNDKSKASRTISDLVAINVLMMIFVYLVLGVVIYAVRPLKDYRTILLLQSTLILFNTVSVDWINAVYEDYLYITVRTVAVQLLYVVCVFLCVKRPDDYLKYVLITTGQVGIVSVANLFHCSRYFSFSGLSKGFLRHHIKPILVFFGNKLAISIYVSVDTTMLGAMQGDYAVGIYGASTKIYAIMKDLMAAVYEVCIPRISYEKGRDNERGIGQILTQMFEITVLVIFPVVTGLFLLAEEVIAVLFGGEYQNSVPVLKILCISIGFAVFGGIVTSSYCIPMGKEKLALKATIYSASLNVILNCVMIPRYSYVGAAITTLTSEAFVLGYCVMRSLELFSYINTKRILQYAGEAIAGSAVIVILDCGLKRLLLPTVVHMCLLIVTSVLLYSATLLIFRNPCFLVIVKRKQR
jgi:O-antigen/teichoic acid export membrane protein